MDERVAFVLFPVSLLRVARRVKEIVVIFPHKCVILDGPY